MPSKTNTEKIEEMSRLVAALTERLDNVRRDTEGLAELATQVALLRQRVEDLRSGWNTWSQRWWMLVPPLVGALAGAVLGYYLSGRR
jgi:hypothetical protein